MSSTKLTRFLKVAIILSVNLALPLISIGKTYSAADFGVFPDSVRVQTSALQAAIDSVAAREGGRLRLPKGITYPARLISAAAWWYVWTKGRESLGA